MCFGSLDAPDLPEVIVLELSMVYYENQSFGALDVANFMGMNVLELSKFQTS